MQTNNQLSFFRIITSLIFFIFSMYSIHAQNWIELNKIVANDRDADDRFGYSTSIWGDYAVVGAYDEQTDQNGLNTIVNAGAAYIYKRDAFTNKWSLAQKISAPDRAINDFFGTQVCIYGDYIVVGVGESDTDVSGSNPIAGAGAIYIYERDQTTNTWNIQQKIVSPQRMTGAKFGTSVSIDNDFIVVGEIKSNLDASGLNPLTDAGAAYIYKLNNNTNTWGLEQKIVASDRMASDIFGISVSIQGNIVVVGAFYNDFDALGANSKSDAGAAYIFERNTSTGIWSEKQKIVSSNRSSYDYFGYAVSNFGDYVIVGSENDELDENGLNPLSRCGGAFVYKRDASTNTWNLQQKIVASDRMKDNNYGRALSIYNNTLVIASDNQYLDASGNNPISNAGAAYIYNLNSTTNTWDLHQKIVASDRFTWDRFGISVDISTDNIIVGAFLEDEDELGNNTLTSAGSAYIFGYCLPLLVNSPIKGDTTICVGNSETLTNITTGGIWKTSNPAIATIQQNGIYTGLASGIDTMWYVVSNSSGCADSVFQIIRVNAATNSITNATICAGNSYMFNGKNYSNTGTYSETLINSVGCDSIAVLNLTVKQQCSTIDSICVGDTVILQSTSNGLFQGWTPSTDVFDANNPSTKATPSVNTTYVGTTLSTSTNLIAHGDFEGVNTASIINSTQYIPWPGSGDLQMGNFAVAQSPRSVHGSLGLYGDHTTGSGNMMVLNGDNQSTTLIWTESVTVQPNTNYAFSTWISSAYALNPAKIQFSINGVLLGAAFDASSSIGVWQQFYIVWNSGTATNALIEIVNQNLNPSGNDFAIDDISFSAFNIVTDTVTVIINTPPIINLNDVSICTGDTYTIDAGIGMDTYFWNTGATTQKVDTDTAGEYIVTISKNGCQASDTMNISFYPKDSIWISEDTTFCEQGQLSGPPNWCIGFNPSCLGYTWSTGELTETINVQQSGKYYLTVVESYGYRFNCPVIDSINVNITQPTSSTTYATICQGDSYTFNGNTYSTSGNYSVNLINSAGCDSIATLHLTVENQVSQKVQIASLKPIYCSNDQVELWVSDSTGGGSNPQFTWYINNIKQTNTDAVFYPVNVTNGDIIRVEMLSSLNCASSVPTQDVYVLNIEPQQTPYISLLETDTTICLGESIQLHIDSISGQGTAPKIDWFVNSILVNSGSSDILLDSLTKNAIVEVVVENTDNCVTSSIAKDVIHVTILPLLIPSMTLTSNPNKACPKTNTTFSVGNMTNEGASPIFTWRINGNLIPETSSSITTDTLSEHSIIEVSLQSSASCTNNVVAVDKDTILQKPELKITSPSDACRKDSPIAITVQNESGTGGAFSIKPITGLTLHANAYTFSPNIAGQGKHIIEATWTDTNSCVNTITQTIEVHDIQAPIASTPVIDIQGELPYSSLQAQGTGAITWYDSNYSIVGNSSSFYPNQSCNTSQCIFTYFVTQKLQPHGCESDSVEVQYIMTSCKVPVPIVKNHTACDYETSKVLHVDTTLITNSNASGVSTILWYASQNDAETNFYAQGQDYTETSLVSGIKKYWVRQYNPGLNCYSPAISFTLEVKTAAQPQVSPNPLIVCEGVVPYPAFNVTAANNAIVNWYLQADTTTQIISHTKSYSPDKSLDTTTLFYVTQIIDNCQSTPLAVQFRVLPKPTIAVVPDGESCEDENHIIFAQIPVGTDIEWYNESGDKVDSDSTFVIDQSWLTADQKVEFKVIVLNSDGCISDTVKTNYELISRPLIPNIIGDDVICLGKDYNSFKAITGGLVDSVIWNNDNDNAVWKGNEFKPDYFINAENYTLKAFAYHKDCKSKQAGIKQVEVAVSPQPKIIGDTTFCVPQLTQIFTKEPSSTNNTINWNVSGNIEYYTLTNNYDNIYLDLLYSGIDTIYLTETSSNKCTGIDSLIIYVAGKPFADFEAETNSGTSTATIQNTSRETTIEDGNIKIVLPNEYIWNFGIDQPLDTNNNKLIYRNYDFGFYQITLTASNTFGCIDSITKQISMDTYMSLYIPNAFSPDNASPSVREFKPIGLGLKSYEIWIYDKWGNNVWYSNKLTTEGCPAEGWNGIYNGIIKEAGSYFWKIEATFKNGKEWKGIEKKNRKYTNFGNVALIR